MLPLPRSAPALLRALRQDQQRGVTKLMTAARNPFQRWAVQRALHSYLHEHARPLHQLYQILAIPELDEYLVAPAQSYDWRLVPPVRDLLLAELANQPIARNLPGDRVVARMTGWLRDRRVTPLTRFAGLLLVLQNDDLVEHESFDLASHASSYADLEQLPDGAEISRSFACMAAWLDYDALAQVATASQAAATLPAADNAIRPPVIAALHGMAQVGAEVAVFRQASSRANQLAASARALDALEQIENKVNEQVVTPERGVLLRIVRQWRQLISEAAGAVGRAAVGGPVANPYVLNNPVVGAGFVGRDDIMRELEELWARDGQIPSVVLFGHRRMGKSSILKNLGVRFGTRTTIVDFNMQRVGHVRNTGELLYGLALAIYDSLPAVKHSMPEPDEAPFQHNPYIALDRLLKQIAPRLDGQRLIIALDEFEEIEQGIAQGRLDGDLIGYWRGLIQTYPWFVMALAGLHTLHEMTHDYWNPLFGSVTGIPVSFLSSGAARQLITNPSDDFSIDYDADAVDLIVSLTNGQPFLVQLLGYSLVQRFNRQTFEEGVEHERRFTRADVEAVLATPEFARNGAVYFTGVWHQAEGGAPAGQAPLLRALAFGPLRYEELRADSGLAEEPCRAALDMLQQHDVVAEQAGSYGFTVELMRRWVEQHT